jgi:hypothetical protein
MASAVAGGLFNAFAFAGAGYLLELVRRIQDLTNKPKPKQPQLSDHYTPSPAMEEYMTLSGLLAGGAVGGAAYFLLEQYR